MCLPTLSLSDYSPTPTTTTRWEFSSTLLMRKLRLREAKALVQAGFKTRCLAPKPELFLLRGLYLFPHK